MVLMGIASLNAILQNPDCGLSRGTLRVVVAMNSSLRGVCRVSLPEGQRTMRYRALVRCPCGVTRVSLRSTQPTSLAFFAFSCGAEGLRSWLRFVGFAAEVASIKALCSWRWNANGAGSFLLAPLVFMAVFYQLTMDSAERFVSVAVSSPDSSLFSRFLPSRAWYSSLSPRMPTIRWPFCRTSLWPVW